MIRLTLDQADGLIEGYEIIDESQIQEGDVVVSEEDVDRDILNKGILTEHNVYYIDGTVVVRETSDYWTELLEIESKLTEATHNVEKESTILIDNLIAGMTLDEAVAIAEENRKLKDSLQEEYQSTVEKHGIEKFPDPWEP